MADLVTPTSTPEPPPPAMSAADVAAHEAASYVRPAAATRTLTSYERRDVRNTVAAIRGW